MKRKFRLSKSADFKRVRRLGKSYAHPFVVLICHPNETDHVRIGISANRSIGNAVKRNTIKRKIREVIRPVIPEIIPGWDIILLARKQITSASFTEINAAIVQLIKKTNLLDRNNDRQNSIR